MAELHEDFSREQTIESSSNRAFGAVFVVAFLFIASWPLAFGGALRWWSLIVSAVIAVITLIAPALLTIPKRWWLRLGVLLNRIISPVVLAFMFYVVVTPMGLLMRALGKDLLRLRHDAIAETYWIKREPPGPQPDSMPRQF